MTAPPPSVITQKGKIAAIVRPMLIDNGSIDLKRLLVELNDNVLVHKVKFPVLEHAAALIHEYLPLKHHHEFCQGIMDLKTEGGNVIVGKMLQFNLARQLEPSVAKALDFMVQGNVWYVCDIIGERVLGHGLLLYPDRMFPLLKIGTRHENSWVVRSVGVAAHYAVKKGLPAASIPELFELLLTLARSTDFHVKKGIGWGAKTCMRFHPHLANTYETAIADAGRWFQTKVKLGIQLSKKYAH